MRHLAHLPLLLGSLSATTAAAADLTTWQTLNSEYFAEVDIEEDRIGLSAYPSIWWEDYVGGFTYTDVSGNFAFSAQVRTSDYSDDARQASWWFSTGGLMVRDPQSSADTSGHQAEGNPTGGGDQNYLTVNLGRQMWWSGLGVQNTTNSSTVFSLHRPSHWAYYQDFTIDLTICRVGSTLTVLEYYPDHGEWFEVERYERPDLPHQVQAGFTAGRWYGGSGGPAAYTEFEDVQLTTGISSVLDCTSAREGSDDAPADSDGDGIPDSMDVCELGDDTLDEDGDTVPDACDPCPFDVLDDIDEDGICDSDDVCQGADDAEDQDVDGQPDACDFDRDGDGADNRVDDDMDDPWVGDNDALVLDYHGDVLTEADAQHLWRRAAFGGTPEDIQFSVDNGLDATLDRLLTMEDTGLLDAEIAAANLEIDSPIRRAQMDLYTRLVQSPNPLQERMVYLYFDLYAEGAGPDCGESCKMDYAHAIRTHALGSARDLAHVMTQSELMLQWLDGNSNNQGNVNENYAREFWELFTLGVDQYTQTDVNESSRAFTGLRAYGLNAGLHDQTDKTIFEGTAWEQVGNFGSTELVDITFDEHPEASRHLARALLRTFVGGTPDEAHVTEVAVTLYENDYLVQPALRQILSSQLFYSASARKNGIKTPIEYVIGYTRALGTQGDPWQVLHYAMEQGQELHAAPSVKGWDDDEYWLQSPWMLNRILFAERALCRARYFYGFEAADLVPSSDATVGEFIDHVAGLRDVQLSAADRERIVRYMTTERDEWGQDERIMFDPNYPWTLWEKTQGMVQLMSITADYQLR